MNGFDAAALKSFAKTVVGMLLAGMATSSALAEVNASTLLQARSPAALSSGLFSAPKLLSLAFHDGELASLAQASGATDCFTNDRRSYPTDFAGRRVSRACIEALERSYYRKFDVIARTRQGAVVAGPSYKTNSLQLAQIQRPAINRLSVRMVSRTVAGNLVLRSLVEGRVDADFSLFSADKPLPGGTSALRPVYALAVNYRESAAQPVRVASLGSRSFGFLGGRSQKPILEADRQIVELWPASSEAPPVATETRIEDLRLTQRLQRSFGLSGEPFSQFHLRIERSGSYGLAGLSLQIQEANGLAKVDLSGLVRGRKDGIAWDFRLPYFCHSAVLSTEDLSRKVKLGYEYHPTASAEARVMVDRNILVGSVTDPAVSRYSLAFGYRF